MASDSVLDKLTEIQSSLMCIICGIHPGPGRKQWYRCLDHHQTCQDCKDISDNKCVCGEPMSSEYCEMTEQLLNIKGLKFKCINTENGCKEIHTEDALGFHESECIYRLVPCLTMQCDSKVPFQGIIQHFEDHKKRALKVKELGSRIACLPGPIKFYLNNQTFLLARKIENDIRYFCVYILGSPNEAKHFGYTLKLFGHKTTNTFEGQVAAIDESFDDLSKAGKCFAIPVKTFSSQFVNEDKLYE